MVFWGNMWAPICGHYFWNNQIGANKFCQQMGYDSGLHSGRESGEFYVTDSFKIGQCNTDDPWKNCSGGCNDYQVGGRCTDSRNGVCTARSPVKITISCSGNSSKSSSCTGKENINNG